ACRRVRGELAEPQRFWSDVAVVADYRGGGGRRRWRALATSADGCLDSRVRGGAGRDGSVLPSDGGHAAPRHDTDRGPDVSSVRKLDQRRGHQCPTRRAPLGDAHAVVGGYERFAVRGRPRNRVWYIGDGHWRLER